MARGVKRDLTGGTFGSWAVVCAAERAAPHFHAMWICRCSCGVVGKVYATQLLNGGSSSCGHDYGERRRALALARVAAAAAVKQDRKDAIHLLKRALFVIDWQRNSATALDIEKFLKRINEPFLAQARRRAA